MFRLLAPAIGGLALLVAGCLSLPGSGSGSSADAAGGGTGADGPPPADASACGRCRLGEVCDVDTCRPADALVLEADESSGSGSWTVCALPASDWFAYPLLATTDLCFAANKAPLQPLPDGATGPMTIEDMTVGQIDVSIPSGAECGNAGVTDLFAAGEKVTLSGSAGSEFPAFAERLAAPSDITITAVTAAFNPGEAVDVQWAPDDSSAGEVVVVVKTTSSDGAIIRCEQVPDTGDFMVPGSLTQFFPSATPLEVDLGRVSRSRATYPSAGGGDLVGIELKVATLSIETSQTF